MSNNLPFIWRRYYRNEPTPSEKVLLDVAHERARQYLSRASASKLLHAHRGATDCGEYRKAAGFAAVGCPLYPQKRTSIERVAMSALCQKRTSTLFDHLIGARENRGCQKQTSAAS